MIVYKNVLARLSSCGWSAYRLAKERQIGNGTLQKIRHNEAISTETVNTICRLCNCQPGDLLEYVEDKGEE